MHKQLKQELIEVEAYLEYIKAKTLRDKNIENYSLLGEHIIYIKELTRIILATEKSLVTYGD